MRSEDSSASANVPPRSSSSLDLFLYSNSYAVQRTVPNRLCLPNFSFGSQAWTKTAKKVVVIGGGNIGLEVAAALTAWKLDVSLVFPEKHIMPRLFTPTIAKLDNNKVKIVKEMSVSKLVPGENGGVAKEELANGTVLDADTVDGLFLTSSPGIFAIGDVAAFPLQIYGRRDKVEHVDHARKSATHYVKSILQNGSEEYDYLPLLYSRIFEYPGSGRKVWWQFYGTNDELFTLFLQRDTVSAVNH